MQRLVDGHAARNIEQSSARPESTVHGGETVVAWVKRPRHQVRTNQIAMFMHHLTKAAEENTLDQAAPALGMPISDQATEESAPDQTESEDEGEIDNGPSVDLPIIGDESASDDSDAAEIGESEES